MTQLIGLSVIIPITERFDDVETVFRAYKRAVEETGYSYEFVYVLDGPRPEVLSALEKLVMEGEPIRVVGLAKWFGEATALTVGFAHSSGGIIMILPAYLQIDPTELPRLVRALEDHDMVAARRFPRRDSILNVIQSKVFHGLLRLMVNVTFHDMGCGVRVLRRHVADELNIYGDQHRFLPLLAYGQGFRVVELDARQAEEDTFRRIYPIGVYARRLLDLLTVMFNFKFTKKPLRFFGLIGSLVLALGGVSTLYLLVERLFLGVALADRPALVLAVLLVVLGVQIIAVGLIGELIIFTHAKEIKEYNVATVIEPQASDGSSKRRVGALRA